MGDAVADLLQGALTHIAGLRRKPLFGVNCATINKSPVVSAGAPSAAGTLSTRLNPDIKDMGERPGLSDL